MSESSQVVRIYKSADSFHEITVKNINDLRGAAAAAISHLDDRSTVDFILHLVLHTLAYQKGGDTTKVSRPTEPTPPTVPHHVYLVQAGANGPIKIGFSEDPQRRLTELQRNQAPPLRLLATLPGGREEEARLHRRFAEHRYEGTEWFAPVPELLALAGGGA